MAQRDRLTGLFNRHRLEELMPELVAEAHKSGGSFSLVVIDLDHFKQINDTYGHAGGDQVLVAVAAALRGTSRPQDIAVRYGGEELLLVLPGIALPQASLGAERLRRHVESLAPDGIPVTCSIGVAALKPGESFESLFKRADAAVYEAKNLGRNQVIAHN
nr:GGDEF domain-containing protein [Niveibacterium umoris]